MQSLLFLCSLVALSAAYPAYYDPPSYYQPVYHPHHAGYHVDDHHAGGYHHVKPKHGYPHKEHYDHPTPYHFEYGVADHYHGTRFDRHENSDGDVVKGSYSVDLPDGRTQHVHYTADHYGGFNAKVTYEGKAYHPTHKHGYEHGGYSHY